MMRGETALELDVATMFRDATQQSIILELRTPEDWDHLNDIRDTAARLEKEEEEAFGRDKPRLLAEATKKLIDKAGSFIHTHPSPVGTDGFGKSKIARQAEIMVENDHVGRVLKIRNTAAENYTELGDDIRAREETRGIARGEFSRVNDRRSGGDRRLPSRDR